MRKHSKKQVKKGKGLFKLLLGLGILIGSIIYMTPRDERKKLIDRIRDKSRKSFKTFVDFCVPHERNGYKPKVFHNRSVKNILLLVIIIKVGVVSLLFAFYPDVAKLAADIQSQMYALTNAYRVEQHEPALSVNSYLEEAAMAKAQDMLAQNYFSHYGPDGKKPWEWIDTSIYNFTAMGENLGMDFLTSGSVFRAFQQSPTHDRNLLNPAYTETGIAVLNGYLDGHTTNLMVVFFGSRSSQPAKLATAETKPVVTQPTLPVATQPAPTKPAIQPVVQPKPTSTSISKIQPTASTSATSSGPIAAITNTNSDQFQFKVTPVALSNPTTEVLGESIGNGQTVFTENMKSGVEFSQGSWLQLLMAWSDRFLMAILIALILLFIINIVVKIKVQHAPIIANAMILILVVAAALYVNINRAEAMGESVKILAAMFIR